MIRVDPRYPGVADTVAPYLSDALERSEGDRDIGPEDLLAGAAAGQFDLWALVSEEQSVVAALVTSIARYPRRAVLEVIAFGCDQHQDYWRIAWEQLQDVARAMGISTIAGTGRPGWARQLQATRTKTVWEYDVETE